MSSSVESKGKVKVAVSKPIEYRISDVGADGREYNVKTSKGWKDKKEQESSLPVGKHNHIPDSKFDPRQLKIGTEIELEHTDNPEWAKAIAKDHLVEIPDYYDRLLKFVEVQGESKMNKNSLNESLVLAGIKSSRILIEGLKITPMTSSDRHAFAGAVDFMNGTPPFMAELKVNGEDAIAVADKNGIQVHLEDGSFYMIKLPLKTDTAVYWLNTRIKPSMTSSELYHIGLKKS